jgi:ankyrin repeat protein
MECKGIFDMVLPLSYVSHRFRWVFCQLEVLRHCFPANLRRTLEQLPKSLDETYKRILKEINNSNRDHAYRLLQCLAVASRPLRVEELAEVLAFDFTGGIPKLNVDWRWEDQEAAVLSACSSLVSVVSTNGSRVVQFAHFSVKEFLTSDRLASSTEEVSGFHVPLEPAHTTLAQACLGVLLRLESDTKTYYNTHTPLVQYAAENWVTHAQFENAELRMKDVMDYFFDTDKPHFSAWVQIHDVDRSWWQWTVNVDRRVPRTPLYCAAFCGFHSLVERLIVKYPQHVSARAGRYGTPLHATLFEEGHIEISKLLIEHGADVNALDDAKRTPLHFVSQFGHLNAAKWLLAHGASVTVNSQTNEGWTPLHWAAYLRHFQIACTLLEHKARVNSRDNHGCTPLHRALQHRESGLGPGQSRVVMLLLDNNADVNVGDNSGYTPLHLAALRGSLEVARKLLELNAEVNSQNHNGYTPLLLALYGGNFDIAQLLLDHNADVHAVDNIRGDTPVHLAASHGSLEIARKLLELNAEVNSKNSHGYTPLFNASGHKHTDVVQLLLDHNADVYVRNGDGDTPLHRAALRGQLEVARILLKLNVGVNSRNNEGSTPLHFASEGWVEGNPDVVRLLLDHGAGAQVRNLSGQTASEVARGSKQQEIVQLLSQHSLE